MYSGDPADLEKYKNEKLQKILDKWDSRRGMYRHDMKIEGHVLYLSIIQTSTATLNQEHDILVQERDDSIDDDQMKIRDKDGKVRRDIGKIKKYIKKEKDE